MSYTPMKVAPEPLPADTEAPGARDKKTCPPAGGPLVQPLEETAIQAEFIRALRAGERATFEQVVHMYAPRVRRLAMRFFSSPFEQEEAVQEVFLLLYRQREQLDPLRGEALPGFIATLARRRMIDLVRAQPPSRWTDEETPPEPEELPDGERDPQQRAQDRELAALLKDFEGRLKPGYRSYFQEVFVEGRDFDEARLHLGLGTLRARYLKRVLIQRLRRHLPLLEYLGRTRAGKAGADR